MSAMCPLDHMQLEDTTMRNTERKYQRQSRNGATTATPPASWKGATLYCGLEHLVIASLTSIANVSDTNTANG